VSTTTRSLPTRAGWQYLAVTKSELAEGMDYSFIVVSNNRSLALHNGSAEYESFYVFQWHRIYLRIESQRKTRGKDVARGTLPHPTDAIRKPDAPAARLRFLAGFSLDLFFSPKGLLPRTVTNIKTPKPLWKQTNTHNPSNKTK
jgi:hypothetical protein